MQTQSVSINFRGGIVSPGYLKEILQIARAAKVASVRFGLRQQMILDVPARHIEEFFQACGLNNIVACKFKSAAPNIVSSYPAAGIFVQETWLREGIYKDIFDWFQYIPQLKINFCDSQQSFVPYFTGHINWVSSSSEHFWHLYIRFPKTNKLYKWKDMVYTNDLVMLSRKIEEEILRDRFLFYENVNADGNILYRRIKSLTAYVSKPVFEETAIDFSLPYYEGFNKMNNQLWLGIYRRDELFPVDFLLDVCAVCLATRVSQLYTTPWKSIIIKGIAPADRKWWDQVLGKYRINVRHAANELNWQIEDGSEEGLQLKRQIIRYFDKEDVRTYGLCFAVQSKLASVMFGTIVLQKEQTKNPHRLKSLERYTILYKKAFNPNERESVVFRESVNKEHLGIYLVNLCKSFYEQDNAVKIVSEQLVLQDERPIEERRVYQCKDCYTVYDPLVGDEGQNVQVGTPFEELPDAYCCSVCEASKNEFTEIKESALTLAGENNSHRSMIATGE